MNLGCQFSNLCTYSSHVFTNPEFSIYNCFFNNCVILAFYNLFWFLNANPLRRDHRKRKISWKKKSGFANSEFLKTCDELVIELANIWPIATVSMSPNQSLLTKMFWPKSVEEKSFTAKPNAMSRVSLKLGFSINFPGEIDC